MSKEVFNSKIFYQAEHDQKVLSKKINTQKYYYYNKIYEIRAHHMVDPMQI